MLLLGGLAAAWFALLLAVDVLLFNPAQGGGFWHGISHASVGDVQGALGNLPEVVVAILGIAITVVSIILQLSATRYTPRVTEMFFRDRANLATLSLFVITSLHCIWVSFAVHSRFFPIFLVITTVVMMTAALLLLVPYFIYVFAFLDPERVVMRLQSQALRDALCRECDATHLDSRHGGVLGGIEQLADIAVNALSQKDRIIASRGVDALKDLVTSYLPEKKSIDPRWFGLSPCLRDNPDFLVMAGDRLAELEASCTWLEWKVFRQYQTIFNESINRMRDIGQLVAINSRYMGEHALRADDRPVVQLAIKFFNTYLRVALNARDVRTAYNVLHQYRQLAEAALHAGWSHEVIELAGYFKYYGQTANQMGLSFVTETAANDLCQLCEVAHAASFAQERQLLSTFLEVDKVPETEAEDRALRGVRKAQVKLATYYLEVGAEALAREIYADMEHERGERLFSIKEEMLAVTDRDFWEVSDRGINFDFLEPSRRQELERFYAWFGDLGAR